MPRKPRMSLEERRARRAERKAAQAPQPSAPEKYVPPETPIPPAPRDEYGKIHVPRYMTPDVNVFAPKLRYALQCYLDVFPRDAVKACNTARMDVEEFKRHLHSPGVREYLMKQEALIDEKLCELRAQARILSGDHLDAATVDLLESPGTPAAVKANLITTGYKRFGMLKEKVEATGAGGGALAFHLVRIAGKKDSDGDAGN